MQLWTKHSYLICLVELYYWQWFLAKFGQTAAVIIEQPQFKLKWWKYFPTWTSTISFPFHKETFTCCTFTEWTVLFIPLFSIPSFFFIPGFSKRKKTQGDASHQTRSSSAAISWMGLGERDQVFPWFTLFPLLTLKPEGLNICQVSLVYCRSQVSSCRT